MAAKREIMCCIWSDARVVRRCSSGFEWTTVNAGEFFYFGDSNEVGFKYDSTAKTLQIVALSGVGVTLGSFSATAQGSGIMVTSGQTVAVYGDDGGVGIGASGGTYKTFESRLLITTSTSSNANISGGRDYLRIQGVANTASKLAGNYGHMDVAGSATVYGGAGVRAVVDLASGSTIASGKYIGSIMLDSNDLGGVHTGKAACIIAPKPAGGALFDAFARFEGNGTIATQASGVLVLTKKITIIDESGNTCYIPAGTFE